MWSNERRGLFIFYFNIYFDLILKVFCFRKSWRKKLLNSENFTFWIPSLVLSCSITITTQSILEWLWQAARITIMDHRISPSLSNRSLHFNPIRLLNHSHLQHRHLLSLKHTNNHQFWPQQIRWLTPIILFHKRHLKLSSHHYRRDPLNLTWPGTIHQESLISQPNQRYLTTQL